MLVDRESTPNRMPFVCKLSFIVSKVLRVGLFIESMLYQLLNVTND